MNRDRTRDYEPNGLIDWAGIKAFHQRAWRSGDDLGIDSTLQIVGENLAEALDLRSNQRVLDVAAGSGNFTLAALRRGTSVISTDYVSPALERARTRAEAEGLWGEFRVADAEALPFQAATFDVVASTFGVMFTPRQDQAAEELARTCRPGGKIGLANWSPDGFIGEAYAIVRRYVPPSLGVPSPTLWGTPGHLHALFEEHASEINVQMRTFNFRYPSPEAWLSTFREVYGPLRSVFELLSGRLQQALSQDLLGLAERCNRAEDGTLVAPSEYLEGVIFRR